MKKRILLISIPAYPLFNKESGLAFGGAELDLYNIAIKLDKTTFDVHFLTGDFNQKKQEILNGVTVHRGQKIGSSSILIGIKNFLTLLNSVRTINPDVIFTEATGWLTVECIIIKILLRKKFVFRSAHTRNINRFTDSRPYGLLYRRLMRYIDCFILQNEQDVPIFKSSFGFQGKTLVIRNLQNVPKTAPLPREDRQHILWVGRSEEIKDPKLFIDVARLLPNHPFVMVAPKTNHEVFSDLENTSRSIRNLTFIPGLERDALMPYFAQALFLINTSKEEGFPNVILEAMKYGTPIISARLDFDSILDKHDCGLISGSSAESISSAIKNTDGAIWDKYSKNSYQFADLYFNIENGIKEYEKLFLHI